MDVFGKRGPFSGEARFVNGGWISKLAPPKEGWVLRLPEDLEYWGHLHVFRPLKEKQSIHGGELCAWWREFDSKEKYFKLNELKHGFCVPDLEAVYKQLTLYSGRNPDLTILNQEILDKSRSIVIEMLEHYGVETIPVAPTELSVNRKASAGFGFLGATTKGQYMDNGCLDKDLPEFIHSIKDCQTPTVWTVKGKKEYLPNKKIDEKNCRTFIVPNADLWFTQAMYCQQFNAKMCKRMDNWCSIGTTYQEGGFDEFFRDLEKSELKISGDCTKYDKSVKYVMMLECKRIRTLMYKGRVSRGFKEYRAKHKIDVSVASVLDYIYEDVGQPFVVAPDGAVFRLTNGGMLSGFGNTSYDNTLMHILIFVYQVLLIKSDATLDYFLYDINAKIFADDHVIGVGKELLSLAKFEGRQDAYKAFGFNLKKEADIVTTTVDDLVFLGAKPRKIKEDYYPVYDIDRVKAGLSIVEKQVSKDIAYVRALAYFILICASGDPLVDVIQKYIRKLVDRSLYERLKKAKITLSGEEFEDLHFSVHFSMVPTIEEGLAFWRGDENGEVTPLRSCVEKVKQLNSLLNNHFKVKIMTCTEISNQSTMNTPTMKRAAEENSLRTAILKEVLNKKLKTHAYDIQQLAAAGQSKFVQDSKNSINVGVAMKNEFLSSGSTLTYEDILNFQQTLDTTQVMQYQDKTHIIWLVAISYDYTQLSVTASYKVGQTTIFSFTLDRDIVNLDLHLQMVYGYLWYTVGASEDEQLGYRSWIQDREKLSADHLEKLVSNERSSFESGPAMQHWETWHTQNTKVLGKSRKPVQHFVSNPFTNYSGKAEKKPEKKSKPKVAAAVKQAAPLVSKHEFNQMMQKFNSLETTVGKIKNQPKEVKHPGHYGMNAESKLAPRLATVRNLVATVSVPSEGSYTVERWPTDYAADPTAVASPFGEQVVSINPADVVSAGSLAYPGVLTVVQFRRYRMTPLTNTAALPYRQSIFFNNGATMGNKAPSSTWLANTGPAVQYAPAIYMTPDYGYKPHGQFGQAFTLKSQDRRFWSDVGVTHTLFLTNNTTSSATYNTYFDWADNGAVYLALAATNTIPAGVTTAITLTVNAPGYYAVAVSSTTSASCSAQWAFAGTGSVVSHHEIPQLADNDQNIMGMRTLGASLLMTNVTANLTAAGIIYQAQYAGNVNVKDILLNTSLITQNPRCIAVAQNQDKKGAFGYLRPAGEEDFDMEQSPRVMIGVGPISAAHDLSREDEFKVFVYDISGSTSTQTFRLRSRYSIEYTTSSTWINQKVTKATQQDLQVALRIINEMPDGGDNPWHTQLLSFIARAAASFGEPVGRAIAEWGRNYSA